MRKLILMAMLLVMSNAYGQDVIPVKPRHENVVEKVDAEKALIRLVRLTKDKVTFYMRGNTNFSDDPDSDIYFIYSSREKKNIPVRISYMRYLDDSLRVYKVEFINRKFKNVTNDLREAFWIEVLKN